jgi:hypothetical protein
MNKLIITAVLALSSAACFGTAAKAQAFTEGNLLLDFRINSNNTANNLEVDLDPLTPFNFSVSQASVAGFSVGDLTAAYGSSWSSTSGLVFSLVAEGGNGSSNVFLSDPGNVHTITPSSPTQGNTTQISAVYGEHNGTSTLTGDDAFIVMPSSADNNSYTDVITNVNAIPYGANNDYGFVPFSTEASATGSSDSITLYEQTPSARGVVATSTELGTFTLTSNGNLAYSAYSSAAPEPSTYALMGLGGLVLFAMRRRLLRA